MPIEKVYSLNPTAQFLSLREWIASLETYIIKYIFTTFSTPSLHATFYELIQ